MKMVLLLVAYLVVGIILFFFIKKWDVFLEKCQKQKELSDGSEERGK